MIHSYKCKGCGETVDVEAGSEPPVCPKPGISTSEAHEMKRQWIIGGISVKW